jgi:hypothetical protein
MSIEKTLEERGSRYGDFETHAMMSQAIKAAFSISPRYEHLEPYMVEALEMFAHKIARMLNGDPYYIDNWHDIAGYATLVEQILERTKEEELPEPVEPARELPVSLPEDE